MLADGTTPEAAVAGADRGRRRRHRRQLRRRAARLPRRAGAVRRARGRRAGALDHAQRRPAAAPRGPVRLRGRAAVLRVDRAAAPRRRRADRRRLLRHDAGPHRRDARRARRQAARRAGTHRPPRRGRPSSPGRPRAPPPSEAPSAMEIERGTRLGYALTEGRFVISVEIDPPRSVRIERTIEAARLLRDAGADLVEHHRLGDGARAHGRDGRRVRDPARPRPRVPRPRHDARPEPDGARVRAAGRARARRPQHPRAHRRPAADRRLPHRHAASGTSTRSA